MSSIAVAAVATSASKHVSRGIERELVHVGSPVSYKVPVNVMEGTYKSPEGDKRFLRTSYMVQKGVVQVFVHADEEILKELVGTRILAEPKFYIKKTDNGDVNLYVDLIYQRPCKEHEGLRLSVMSWSREELSIPDDCRVFETPAPRVGCVILSPYGRKLQVKGNPHLQQAKPAVRQVITAAPRLSAAELRNAADVQLQRLLTSGWNIVKEDDREVLLRKEKDGKVRTLTHKRPKRRKK